MFSFVAALEGSFTVLLTCYIFFCCTLSCWIVCNIVDTPFQSLVFVLHTKINIVYTPFSFSAISKMLFGVDLPCLSSVYC